MQGSCFARILYVVVLCTGTFSSVSAQQPLPDTSQELCYDDAGDLVDCTTDITCPGQDGSYTGSSYGCPLAPYAGRFEVDDDGTGDDGFFSGDPGDPLNGRPTPVDDVVKDNCTGLMWTRAVGDFSGDGVICTSASSCPDILDLADWESAVAFCDNLVFAGFDDWRLPSIRELVSITNFDQDPAEYGVIPGSMPTAFIFYGDPAGKVSSTSRVDVFTGGFCAATPSTEVFNTVWGWQQRPGTTRFGNCKRSGGVVHPVRTMLPGDAGAGGGVGVAGAEDNEAERGGAERGGGAGPLCADDNGNGNGDGARDLSDAVYELAWLFQGGPEPVPFCTAAGPKDADCAVENGDTNGDEARDLSDVVYLLAWLFQGGPVPVLKCGGPPVEEICDGLGVDEDGDGDTDCDDSDCIGQAGCPGPEICTGDFDEDGDGATDCFDQDCANSPDCYVEGGTGLPDTGLRSCYTIDRRLTPCPAPGEAYYGQDGSYDTGCGSRNRFTDNGDGTVTDECTGLMWQKDTGNGGNPLSWCDALVYCEVTLDGFTGHNDWRMPNIVELESLVHYGFLHPPMIDPIFEDTDGTAGVWYWTSTSKLNGGRTNGPPQTYVVEFHDGSLHHVGDKDSDLWLVRAVRGP